jgi:hypothetical protein
MDENESKYEHALGAAVVRIWGELPRAVQEALFEQAVAGGSGYDLREHLAVFLHSKHPRTDHHAS